MYELDVKHLVRTGQYTRIFPYRVFPYSTAGRCTRFEQFRICARAPNSTAAVLFGKSHKKICEKA